MQLCRELPHGVLHSTAGSAALSPALGVANLAAGLLNLGLAGYNTYQLRGISKQQKVSLAYPAPLPSPPPPPHSPPLYWLRPKGSSG